MLTDRKLPFYTKVGVLSDALVHLSLEVKLRQLLATVQNDKATSGL